MKLFKNLFRKNLNFFVEPQISEKFVPYEHQKANVQLALYNQIGNRSSNYQKRIYEITFFWFQQLHYFNQKSLFGPNDFLYDDSIDGILHQASNSKAKYLLVIALGQLIKKPSFIQDIVAFAESNQADLVGHILDRKERWYSLHHQCFLLNIESWKSLGQTKFGNYQTQGKEFIGVHRSEKNIHDDYTPHWILPNKNQKIFVSNGVEEGWQLLESFLLAEKKIINLLPKLREHKEHIYPDDNDLLEDILIKKQNKEAENICQKQFLQHTDIHTEKSKFYIFNTEDISMETLNKKQKVENLFALAAGFKPLIILKLNGIENNCRITYYDHSPIALKFRKFLIQNWNGKNYKKIIQDFIDSESNKQIHTAYHNYLSFEENIQKNLLQFFPNENEWIVFWQEYKNLPHEFLLLNLLDNYQTLLRKIRSVAGQKNYLWISNCFYFDSAIAHLGMESVFEKRNQFLAQLHQCDPKIKIDIKDPFFDGVSSLDQINRNYNKEFLPKLL